MAPAPSASASPLPPSAAGRTRLTRKAAPTWPGPQAADTHTPCLLQHPLLVLSPHISKPLWVFQPPLPGCAGHVTCTAVCAANRLARGKPLSTHPQEPVGKVQRDRSAAVHPDSPAPTSQARELSALAHAHTCTRTLSVGKGPASLGRLLPASSSSGRRHGARLPHHSPPDAEPTLR